MLVSGVQKTDSIIHTQVFIFVVVVQSLSCVQFFVTPRTAAHQASLFFTVSLTLLKLMSIESMMLSNHLIFCHPLLPLPSIFPRSFPMSQLFASGSQSTGESASASVLLMNIQSWLPLGLTEWISLQFKGLSRVFSNTTVRNTKHHSSLVLSLL